MIPDSWRWVKYRLFRMVEIRIERLDAGVGDWIQV